MAEVSFFDDLESGLQAHAPQDPIWSMDLDDEANEDDIHKWLVGELQYLQSKSDDRIKRQRRNLALYKGIQYETQDVRQDRRDIGESRSNIMRKIVVNHLYDLAKNRASRLIKYKPAVSVLPTNDEFSDKVSAKLTKALLDHIWYEEKFEGEVSLQVATWAMIMGECFLFPKWNPQAGDLNPAYKASKEKAEKEGRKIPLLDESGLQKKDGVGNPIWIDRPVRTGDVQYEIPMPCDVILELKTRWADINYMFVCKSMPVDEARALFPKAADKIKADEQTQVYDYERMQLRPPRNEVMVYTFYHKRTEFMDKGRMIAFTKSDILDSVDFPFSHMDLPCVRFTDVDYPGEVHGYSFFEAIKGLTGTYNNLTNMILRNQILVSHPKWMVPVGAVKLDQLGNDITMVQYKGPTPPVLVQANPTPSEVFAFRDKLKEEFQQIAGVFGVSRGEPPPGIKAGVALQFLSEQESERFNELVLKWNEFIRQTAIQTLAVAGDYYEASDERMIRVIGNNNGWMSQFFDVAHLSKDYDIRIQNSSALPSSKAARMQTLLDLNQQFPDQMPAAQVLDLLDLGQSEKFTDIVTESIRSAEAENEKILDEDGKDDQFTPEEYEDHIQHWKVHVRKTQNYAFKYMTPTESQDKLKDHIIVHEMMMYERGKKNPAYGQLLTQDPTLQLFPIFFVPPEFADTEPTQTDKTESVQSAAPGGAIQDTQGMPVNPIQGGAPQELAAPPMPGIEQQMAAEPAVPTQPTGAM